MRLSERDSQKVQGTVTLKDGQEACIRLAEEEDERMVWEAYEVQPEEFFRFIPVISEELVREWYEEIDHSKIIPINAFLQDGEKETKFIGNCTLTRMPFDCMKHVIECGLGVISDFQDLGLGGYLLDTGMEVARDILHAERIELDVVVENYPAIRLYHERGFKVEGKMEMRWKRDGAYYDVYKMGRLLE